MAASAKTTDRHVDSVGDGAERLDVVPLLKSYRDALRLARCPPASLRLPGSLERLHLRLRPTFGSHHCTTRYVRRRVEALERALAARAALNEADHNDEAELEALRKFRSSLTPPPSRGWTIAGLLAAILLAQALVGSLLADSRIEKSLRGLSLTPDVKSIGDLVRTVTSANVEEIFIFILVLTAIAYLFGRPIAAGYRIAHMCLGRRARLGSRRRTSPLHEQAMKLEIATQEAQVAKIAGAHFRRGFPLDLAVKAAPWLVVAMYFVIYLRFGGGGSDAWAWLVAAGGFSTVLLGLLAWPPRRARWLRTRTGRLARVTLSVVGLGLASWLFVATGAGGGGLWVLAVLIATLARLGWLARQMHGRGHPPLLLGLPLAVVVAIATAGPLEDYADVSTDQEDHRRALAAAKLESLPTIGRRELQVLLASRPNMSGVDLRGQDLHSLWLRGKRLAGAQFALADLRDTDLRHAVAPEANFLGANLRRAELQRANLTEADFRCADLRGADLRGSAWTGADFRFAVGDARTRWPVSDFDMAKHRVITPQQMSGWSIDTSFWPYVEICLEPDLLAPDLFDEP